MFSSPVATADFSKFAGILSAGLSQHYLLGLTKLSWNSTTSSNFAHNDAPLTLHSKISSSRQAITPWLCRPLRSFLYSSSVYPCHLFLISSASVRSIPLLSFTVPIFFMRHSLGISNFLEEISSLSHSIVSLYFFVLFTQEFFLISPFYSLKLCIQVAISFLLSFAFFFSSFLSYLLGLLR